jgi:hypothetical protein
MTVLLKEAFDKVSKLPETIQDEIAMDLLANIETEGKWDQTFKETGDKLTKMADKALTDFKAGKIKKMGFDEL